MARVFPVSCGSLWCRFSRSVSGSSCSTSSFEVPDRVVVGETGVAGLAEHLQRTWMRPPTRQKLEGLGEDSVKEEMLHREAVALGLDRDDPIIRRRMRQKMEFLNAGLTEQSAPSDAELRMHLDANRDKFVRPDRFSFQRTCIQSGSLRWRCRSAGRGTARAHSRGPGACRGDKQSPGDLTLLPAGAGRWNLVAVPPPGGCTACCWPWWQPLPSH